MIKIGKILFEIYEKKNVVGGGGGDLLFWLSVYIYIFCFCFGGWGVKIHFKAVTPQTRKIKQKLCEH